MDNACPCPIASVYLWTKLYNLTSHPFSECQASIPRSKAFLLASNLLMCPALPGGERSFTMVALLLAVGQHCETKFRCMDEFDV